MTRIPFAPLVEALPAAIPFVGPETQERTRGRPFKARLGANEGAFGPSPAAIEAMAAAAADVWRYGEETCHPLRAALAEAHGIPIEAVLVGEGIDGLLGLAVRLMVSPGDAVVTSAGAYPTFAYHVTGFGGRLHAVPYRDDHEDPEALLAAAAEQKARLVYLANPDNPMGSWHGAKTVGEMIARLPEGCVLCLDEAYAEFAPEGTLPPIDIADPRVLRLRTFSKAHGLAGLRVGYAIGHPELIAGFHRIRNHFGVNRIGQAAALASLGDPGHIARVRRLVEESRARIAAIAADAGLTALPSAANFVAVDCGADGDFARAVLAGLLERDVFVRMPGIAPLDRCIRISCGPEDEMALLAEALPAALADARETSTA